MDKKVFEQVKSLAMNSLKCAYRERKLMNEEVSRMRTRYAESLKAYNKKATEAWHSFNEDRTFWSFFAEVPVNATLNEFKAWYNSKHISEHESLAKVYEAYMQVLDWRDEIDDIVLDQEEKELACYLV